MNAKKTQFQEDMTAIERDLTDYKNGYPKNIGDMVRRKLPVFMIILSILLFAYSFSNYESVEMAPCLIAPSLFLFGVVTYAKFHSDNVNYDGVLYAVRTKMDSCKQTFATYPDVQNYLQKVKDDLSAECARKEQIKKKFNIVFWGILIAFGIVTVLGIRAAYIQSNSTMQRFNKDSDDQFRKVLDLNTDEPFLIIKPLTIKISDEIEMDGSPLTVYLDYFKKKVEGEGELTLRALSAPMPMFRGNVTGDEVLRLTITDLDGKPVRKCPDFLFVPNEVERMITSTCFDFEFKNRSHKQNEFEMIQTMRYLQDHQDSLRFMVQDLFGCLPRLKNKDAKKEQNN